MDDSLCQDDKTPPVTPAKFCSTNQPDGRVPVAWEFFRQARTAPDQIRVRMAHVWHQIFVVGSGSMGLTYARCRIPSASS